MRTKLRQTLPGVRVLLLIVGVIGTYSSIFAQAQTHSTSVKSFGCNLQTYSIKFTENRGQLADQNHHAMSDVQYFGASGGVKLYLTKHSLHFVFSRSLPQAFTDSLTCILHDPKGILAKMEDSLMLERLDLEFVGSNPSVQIEALDKTSDLTNYYLANCPNGILDVPSYQTLIYHNLYPLIDMIVKSDTGGVTYDFLVHPGGDPSAIRMRYGGAKDVFVDEAGNLIASTTLGSTLKRKPLSYEYRSVNTNERKSIAVKYVVNDLVVSYKARSYDLRKNLLIDPSLQWATYFGGAASDDILSLAADRHGNIWATGITNSTSHITTSGAFDTVLVGASDAFVAKYNSAGVLLWSTYFGGEVNDNGWNVAIDLRDNGYIIGSTFSTTGIATGGSYQPAHTIGGTGPDALDAYLVKFDPQGHRLWGTYYGGAAADQGLDVTVDSLNNVIIGGETHSTTGIASTGAYQTSLAGGYDCFLAKFDSSGTRVWGTFFGGPSEDGAYKISSDRRNNILVTGLTRSTSGLTTTGAYQTAYGGGPSDAFVAKFTPSGTLGWCTYYGGSSDETGFSVACDGGYNVISIGQTESSNGIATVGAFQTAYGGSGDGYISKFDSTGNLLWSSYYGGSATDQLLGTRVDQLNNIYVAGFSSSTSGIATAGQYQTMLQGANDAILAKFNASGMRLWGTYFGGPGSEGANGIALDSTGNAIIGGSSSSSTGIAYHAAQSTFGGSDDGFIAKFCDIIQPQLSRTGIDTVCIVDTLTLNLNNSYLTYNWYDGDSVQSSATSRSYHIADTLSNGLHTFYVYVTNANGCTAVSDSFRVLVHTSPVVALRSGDTLCAGDSVKLTASVTRGKAPFIYRWSPGKWLSDSTILQPVGAPLATTTYTLTVIDSNGCSGVDSMRIIVHPSPQIHPKRAEQLCAGESVVIGDSATGGTRPYIYFWSPTSGLSATNIARPKATPGTTTTYYEYVTDNFGCSVVDSVKLTVNPLPTPTVLPASANLCGSDSVMLVAPLGYVSYVWNTGTLGRSLQVQTPGKYTVTVTDASGCTGTSDTVIVMLATPPMPIIAGPSSVCPNSKAVYSILGDSGATYLWSVTSGGAIQTGQTAKSVTIQWTSAGTITITETNASGCTHDTSLAVTVSSTLTPTVTPAGPVLLCQGDSTTLSAQPGYTSYKWSSGASTQSITVSKSGSYTVTVTALGGCTGTSAPIVVTVSPNPKPKPILTASATSFCVGDSTQISTTQSFTTYLWSTGATTPMITVKKSGLYSLIVTNASGCTGNSDSITITVNPKPTAIITASGPTTFCSSDSVTLTATAGGKSYLWSDGEITQSIITRKSGDYSVRVTNASGCDSTSALVHVTVNATPQPLVIGPTSVCPSSQTNYSIAALQSSKYNWVLTGGAITSGQSTNTISVTWGASGAASIAVTQTDTVTGCSGTATLDVTIDNNFVPVITANGSLAFCQGDSVTLDAGAGYASYQWLFNNANILNATREKLTVNASGSYSVFVTNSGSCQGTSKAITATVNPTPVAPIIMESGSTLISTASTNYQWSLKGNPISGATLDSLKPLQAGDYTVTIIDQNGCSNISKPFTFTDSGETTIAVPLMTTANPADNVKLPIELLRSQRLAQSGAMHYTAKLRFNKTLLVPSGATPTGVIIGNDLIVTISGTNPLPLGTTSGTLATLDFLATLGNDTCTDVSIDEFIWTDGTVRVTRENGRFCLTGVCEAGGKIRLIDPNAKLSLGQSHPNPAQTQTTVDYDLDEQGETELFITDIVGKEVRRIAQGVQIPGHYSAIINLEGMAQGVYICVLKTPSAKLSHLMQISR